MNYFELFSLPIDFLLDAHALAGRYRQLQAQFHPDKYAHESAQMQQLALQKAALINDAYHTLKSPLQRAQYLLTLQGIDLQAEQQTLGDMDFLMQQMQLREQLDAIAHSGKPEAALSAFQGELAQLQTQLQTDFHLAYVQQNFSQAADWVRKLKFFARLTQQAEQLEEQLLDY